MSAICRDNTLKTVPLLTLNEHGDLDGEIEKMEAFNNQLLACKQQSFSGRFLNNLVLWIGAIWKGVKPLLRNFLSVASEVSVMNIVLIH